MHEKQISIFLDARNKMWIINIIGNFIYIYIYNSCGDVGCGVLIVYPHIQKKEEAMNVAIGMALE